MGAGPRHGQPEMGRKGRWTSAVVRNLTKNHVVLFSFACVSVVSLTLVLVTYNTGPRQTVRSIASGARHGIDRLHKQLSSVGGEEVEKMRVEGALFAALGLPLNPDDVVARDLVGKKTESETPREAADLWPNSAWRKAGNASEPVVVTAVRQGQAGDAVHFLRNNRLFLPDSSVVVFDMGMSNHELSLVKSYCSDAGGSFPTSWCSIRKFPRGDFPSHVGTLSTNAFRPIAIQTVLKDAGSVLFMEVDQNLVTGNVTRYLNFAKAQGGGVAAWPMKEKLPTTSLTHPNMFGRFLVEGSVGDYRFQHMVSMEALLLYYTETVRDELMVPWIKCALTADCIDPVGAQRSGCRLDKKPRFRYSGCHAYDVSSLNVVLGQMFGFDESRYVLDREDRFFESTLKEDSDPNDADVTQDGSETTI